MSMFGKNKGLTFKPPIEEQLDEINASLERIADALIEILDYLKERDQP